MDCFPQQIEEEHNGRLTWAYDVVMESPLERKMASSLSQYSTTNNSIGSGIPTKSDEKMNSSMNSTLEDTTPSDSGVQLDSEVSDIMIESLNTQNDDLVMDYDEFRSAASAVELVKPAEEATVIDSNSNFTTTKAVEAGSGVAAVEDAMSTSTCSTFDTNVTENIVYRRKVRKAVDNLPKAPKKRVSFHEDILKSKRTDNIHIEHGFITYKNGRKVGSNVVAVGSGRYSWCAAGDGGAATAQAAPTELCAQDDGDANGSAAGSDGGGRRRVVYRNACSDVLDYGNSDVYDTNEASRLQYDNSGVFEYVHGEDKLNNAATAVGGDDLGADKTAPEFYRCSCSSSSSNSSLDSEDNDKNSNHKKQYEQSKSSSCDCIGMSSANNNLIGDNCYYSEPNINEKRKSVWNKEKKPKSSCLKKTSRANTTNIILEQDIKSKVKKFNVHDVNQILDNSSKMLFGSLKSIFTLPLPERGVPEGSEDLQSVVECTPDLEQTPEHKRRPHAPPPPPSYTPDSPTLKAKPFLSKSLDGSKQQQVIKQFVHNVDEQLRRKKEEELYMPTRENSAETPAAATTDDWNEHSKSTLQRQEEIDGGELVHDATDFSETGYEMDSVNEASPATSTTSSVFGAQQQQFRNKFIINCESTVFEHTGVSYETQTKCYLDDGDDDDDDQEHSQGQSVASSLAKNSPIAQAESSGLRTNFISSPFAKTFTNFFKSLKETSPSAATAAAAAEVGAASRKKSADKRVMQREEKLKRQEIERQQQEATNKYFALKLQQQMPAKATVATPPPADPFGKSMPNTKLPTATSSSTISDLTMSIMSINSNSSSLPPSSARQYNAANTSPKKQQQNELAAPTSASGKSLELRPSLEKQTRHLPSPLKKRYSGSNIGVQQMQLPPRYGVGNATMTSGDYQQQMDTATAVAFMQTRGAGCGRDSKSTILSDDFDDILTITTSDTDTDKPSDIVILDYPDIMDRPGAADYANLLKPPTATAPAAKTSLINRFLRNVTQKKIMETSIRKNNFFALKLSQQQRVGAGLVANKLYVPGAKPKNVELIDDLNAEIAMEVEMNAANSPRRELTQIIDSDLMATVGCGGVDCEGDVVTQFETGIGEVSIELFRGREQLPMLREAGEQLMKVFKLYTGYTSEGYMVPVLVFLSDKALYVTDLVRNRLCTKFVLPYAELDVILMGPYGNTVLLSNSSRDMQQVLLAGGPYPADALVANLELCARRSGSPLPAVGQLTFEHLAPLQNFVRANCCIDRDDKWMYYAVVNVPASALGVGQHAFGDDDDSNQEPLGPHVKGFLMHRRVKQNASVNQANRSGWSAGYFLLKAGVLYMFNDSTQKLPSWAVALAECQGARRAVKTGRPHCFEILLKTQILQLAAPDEYVASEWLQSLLQSASGLFEMQEKHKTLGCSLVVTQNHLITLREDFTAPLRQVSKEKGSALTVQKNDDELALQIPQDFGSVQSSAMSTPVRGLAPNAGGQQLCSSLNSTPTKLSQLSRSSANTTQSITTMSCSYRDGAPLSQVNSQKFHQMAEAQDAARQKAVESYTNMSSVYGKNSGLEILTCANIKEMTGIKISSHNDAWWCILEFSCQEAPLDCSDDLVLFFATSTEMQRFLRLLEQLWQSKNNDLFPITILDEDDFVAEQCSQLYMNLNRAWEPLLTAALGYPL